MHLACQLSGSSIAHVLLAVVNRLIGGGERRLRGTGCLLRRRRRLPDELPGTWDGYAARRPAGPYADSTPEAEPDAGGCARRNGDRLMGKQTIRLGADVGGTFTDIALDCRGRMFSAKVLTNYSAPEQAILDGIEIVLRHASIGWPDLDIVIHGT